MRAVMIFGAMALALVSVQDAEARGRRGGRVGVGVGVGVGYSSSSRSEDASAKRATMARATPIAPDPAFLRPILPVRAPAEAAAPTRSASASCAGGRLVGQGAGFCQLN